VTNPYYVDDHVTLYHGDCLEILDQLEADVLVTDPPYPNKAGHFVDAIATARLVLAGPASGTSHRFVVWHQLAPPPSPLPLIALHVWHKTNTNRPDNYEPIYEFGAGPERPSKVFPYPVVYKGLTGCVEATDHPTQKPERLIKRLLTLPNVPSGMILDPFMGSGTTLRAAKDLGRQAIGIELDERYCEIAASRCAQEVLPLDTVTSGPAQETLALGDG
jgi:DNA modification methylase